MQGRVFLQTARHIKLNRKIENVVRIQGVEAIEAAGRTDALHQFCLVEPDRQCLLSPSQNLVRKSQPYTSARACTVAT